MASPLQRFALDCLNSEVVLSEVVRNKQGIFVRVSLRGGREIWFNCPWHELAPERPELHASRSRRTALARAKRIAPQFRDPVFCLALATAPERAPRYRVKKQGGERGR